MPMHMSEIETLRGNARALGTFASTLPGIAGSDPRMGVKKQCGRPFAGAGAA